MGFNSGFKGLKTLETEVIVNEKTNFNFILIQYVTVLFKSI